MALTAKSVALDIIEHAQAAASSPADHQKIDQALGFMVEAQLFLEASDYLGTVDKFRDALGKAQSVL